MSINYAQLRKQARRSSLHSNFSQYHKLSQDKSFTEHFPLQYKQNQPSLLDCEEQQVDFKNHPFTFQERTEQQKTEVTKKKFVFDDNMQTTKQSDFKHFIAAMDQYIDHLNESTDSFVMSTEPCPKLENMLFQKLNIIRMKHEELLKKQKDSNHAAKQLRIQNQQLKQQLVEQHQQAEVERSRLHHQNQQLKQKYKDLLLKSQYIHNSYVKEKLKNENNKIMGRMHHDSTNQDTQQTYETNESNVDDSVTRFLKSQMRKLQQNNQQIDRIQDKSLYFQTFKKKYSDNNVSYDDVIQ